MNQARERRGKEDRLTLGSIPAAPTAKCALDSHASGPPDRSVRAMDQVATG